MKNKLLRILLFSLSLYPAFSQNSGWEWVKSAGGTFIQTGSDIARDQAGNLFVTGKMMGTCNFDTIQLVATGSSYDMFVAKYDANGNVLWAKKGGGLGTDEGRGVSTDPWGNCYVTGNFDLTAVFSGDTLVAAGGTGSDMFMAKYDANGNLVWIKRTGDTGSDAGVEVNGDTLGNQYFAGQFSTAIIFGSDTLYGGNVFVVKCDTGGNVIWAKEYGNASEAVASAAIDPSGNVFVTGYFYGTTILGGDTFVVNGSTDAYFFKTDNNGNLQWAKTGSSPLSEYGEGIAADQSGNSFFAGRFEDTAVFSGNNIISAGGTDIFIAKYDPNGNLLWLNRAGGSLQDAGTSLSTDNIGNCFIVGWHSSTPSDFGSIQVNSAGSADMFIASYDPSGNVRLAKGAGSASGNDEGQGICTDENGQSYVTGTYIATASFDTITLNTAGGQDIYVGKFKLDFSIDGNFFHNGSIPVDSGTAYLLQYNNTNTPMKYLDTVPISSSGYFQFKNKYIGNYLVLAEADSSRNPWVVPTYLGNTAFWSAAADTVLNDNITLFIYGIEVDTALLNGQAIIQGRLLQGNYSGKVAAKGDALTSINTSVVDRVSNTIINISKTDTGGRFIFNDMQAGSYYIYVNIPGIPMDTITYKVDVTTPDTIIKVIGTADSTLIYFSKDSTGTFIPEWKTQEGNNISVFPNPFYKQAYLLAELTGNADVKIELYDLLGRRLMTVLHENQEKGIYKAEIRNSSKGVFILKVQLGKQTFIRKLVQVE